MTKRELIRALEALDCPDETTVVLAGLPGGEEVQGLDDDAVEARQVDEYGYILHPCDTDEVEHEHPLRTVVVVWA